MARHGEFSVDDLRRLVESVCTSGDEHLIVSYSRRTFLQTGDGHFSPIGGYHQALDLVLILDVARFKYPPHWVPLPMLYEAMSHLDPVTGLPRGYLLVTALPLLESALFTLSIRQDGWQRARECIAQLPYELARFLETSAEAKTGESAEWHPLVTSAVHQLASMLHGDEIISFLALRTGQNAQNDVVDAEGLCIPAKAIEALLEELRSLPLFQVGYDSPGLDSPIWQYVNISLPSSSEL